jgi:hypothetical protein
VKRRVYVMRRRPHYRAWLAVGVGLLAVLACLAAHLAGPLSLVIGFASAAVVYAARWR